MDVSYQIGTGPWRVQRAEVDGVIVQFQYSYASSKRKIKPHSFRPVNGTVMDDQGIEHHVRYLDPEVGWVNLPLDRDELNMDTLTP